MSDTNDVANNPLTKRIGKTDHYRDNVPKPAAVKRWRPRRKVPTAGDVMLLQLGEMTVVRVLVNDVVGDEALVELIGQPLLDREMIVDVDSLRTPKGE